jgi:hypothetical protein
MTVRGEIGPHPQDLFVVVRSTRFVCAGDNARAVAAEGPILAPRRLLALNGGSA